MPAAEPRSILKQNSNDARSGKDLQIEETAGPDANIDSRAIDVQDNSTSIERCQERPEAVK
jgi:hypothetical protein